MKLKKLSPKGNFMRRSPSDAGYSQQRTNKELLGNPSYLNKMSPSNKDFMKIKQNDRRFGVPKTSKNTLAEALKERSA